MYLFKIRTIERPIPRINGLEYSLDFPESILSEVLRLNLSLVGWISSKYERISYVQLMWRGRQIADAKVFARPDLESIYEGCNVVGFQLTAAPLVLGDQEPLKIVVVSESGRTSTLYELYLDFHDDHDSNDSRHVAIAPLIALARSGTTHLFKLLYDSKLVLGYNNYPYEAHVAEQYAKRWFENAQPTAYEPTWNKGSPNIDPTTHAILDLYNNRDKSSTSLIASHIKDAALLQYKKIVDYYKWLSPDISSPTILEKISLSYEIELLRCIFPKVRPIFLLRDPRDIVVSVRSVNESRRSYDFDEAHSRDFEDLVKAIGSALRELTWRLDHCPDKKIVVHYEDLIREPQTTLEQIRTLFETATRPTQKIKHSEDDIQMRNHLTSKSPASSVGRWRQALTRSEQEIANWYFQPFLARFGYELG